MANFKYLRQMKYVLCFIGLFALFCILYTGALDLHPEAIQKLQEFAGKCQAKTPEEMQKLMQHEVPTTRNAKCFMACMKKELGFMNADNSMNGDTIRSKMEQHLKDKDLKEKGLKIIEMCQTEVPVDKVECEVDPMLMECCVKHSKEMGIETLSIMGSK